jgi:YHS domain-containing protein
MRLLLLAFLAYLTWTVLRAWLRLLRPGARRSPDPASSPRGAEMVRDPHCGTFVPRDEALPRTVEGKTRYFCSKECRDAYDGRE